MGSRKKRIKSDLKIFSFTMGESWAMYYGNEFWNKRVWVFVWDVCKYQRFSLEHTVFIMTVRHTDGNIRQEV